MEQAGFDFQIIGAVETLKMLKKLGEVMPNEIKGIMFEAGVIMVRDVHVPIDSGELASTLRVSGTQKGAMVRIGRPNVGYYGTFIEYGTKTNPGAKNPFLLEAKKRQETNMINHIETKIAAITDRVTA